MLPSEEMPNFGFGDAVFKTTFIVSASRPVSAGFSDLETLAILLTFGVMPEYVPSLITATGQLSVDAILAAA